MQIDNTICGTTVADEIWRVVETIEPLEENKTIMCECGGHEAKFRLTDELGSNLKLCSSCLDEVINECDCENTKYEIKNI
ncbi:MAG: hypothetical protein RR795_01500 [Cetobacterium sp.]|uniref:hypothetical protein n=1 Tax=Cetobacterium sp. TaxID=2071632 RepID=UPI002FC73756